MDFDFSHTWLDWDNEEKEWYNSFFTEIYPVFRSHHKDASDEECQAQYKELVSEIVSIIAKGLFVKAHEICLSYSFYHLHKHPRVPEDNFAYNDQQNIKKFLSNLDDAIEIEFELRPRTLQSDLLGVNDTFLTIMAINIKWIDSEGKKRQFTGYDNGGRIEAYLHFHELFLKLGWEDQTKIKTHLYKGYDEDFQSYIEIVKSYFSRFIEYKHYTKGKGLKEFGKDCHELAMCLYRRIDELSSVSGPDRTRVAILILALFRIPYDIPIEYNDLVSKVDHDVFAKYLTVS